MTREESKEYIRRYSNGLWGAVIIEYMDKMIDQIFNNHEAQLKAKDEEIAKYQMAIDKQSKRAETLKQLSLDKDNEIATAKMRHKLEHDRYLITEAIIKEKDEEIEMLKAECEYDQRNASMSQRESVMLLDKIDAVIKLCEEKITDWRVIESGQEKAYQAILSMLKDTK